MVVAAGLCLPATTALAETRVAVVTDGNWDQNAAISSVFIDEITALTEGEFEVTFPPELQRTADWTVDGVRSALDEVMAAPDVDLVLAMGVLASHEVARRGALPVPTIAPFVIDHEIQDIPRIAGASGVANLAYVQVPDPISHDFETFAEVVDFERIAFLGTGAFLDAIPDLTSRIQVILDGLGVAVEVVRVDDDPAAALARIPDGVDAAYLVALPQLDQAQFETLLQGLHARGLPTFSTLGRADVERGVLVGVIAESLFARIARRVALDVQGFLLGDPLAEMPVTVSVKRRLTLNMATARELGVSPSFAVLTEAELIAQPRREASRTVTFDGAITRALSANLDLTTARATLDATRAGVGEVRSNLLPSIEADATGLVIDEDRAAASLGSQAERSLTVSATATQVLWSDDAVAGFRSSRAGARAAEAGYAATRLDIATAAATAYLNVLLTKSLEGIERENLELTRSNLEEARVRESVGAGGPSEVYRWEAEIARGRRAVIDANATRNLAEMELNRILHHPLEESFLTEEVSLGDGDVPYVDPRLQAYLDDPWSFRILRDFMAGEAVDHAPELRELDAGIAAREHQRNAARRSFFSPTLALSAGVAHELEADGAGTGSGPSPLDAFDLPEADETDWNVALRLSIPLFAGGDRFARSTRTDAELRELRVRRDATRERIEQRARSAMHETGSSYAAIALSRSAADAAGRNLDLVRDAYAQGVVSIIDLLDAQNAAFVAEQSAAIAVHEFLLDYVAAKRAAGLPAAFADPAGDGSAPEPMDDFCTRLDAFAEEARARARENQP